MDNISIDIETYSSVDLKKCGVYKYVESDDFEILLFAYSVDGSEVKVIDLAKGEEIPVEILDALTDENISKWAFNAQFERVCISRYLRDKGISLDPFYDNHELSTSKAMFLNPTSWKCTMIWSATLGLPLSLEGVGAVLGLDKQKLSEGKNLIKYFCVPCTPTKTNGGRTRNLYFHDEEKWEQFKSYNKRDVEVEMGIQDKLSRFLVSRDTWDEFYLDQEINDRGIAIDPVLVESAIEIDSKVRENIMKKLVDITGLENPNSVLQMRTWLSEHGLEMESLGKKEVAKEIKTASKELVEVLTLRQQLSKSSVKKYTAMKNAACTDNRERGMFRYYGANRTGRFCLTGDHEVLTKKGWVRMDEWNGGSIACWNSITAAISFQKANSLSFDYSGDIYLYEDSRINQLSTPEHKMRVKRNIRHDWSDMTVEEMSKCRPLIPMRGFKEFRATCDPIWLRIIIMTQADGFYTEDGSVRYHFKKVRKVERCKSLLRKAEIIFTSNLFKNGVSSITIPSRAVPIWLRQFTDKTFGYWLFDENPDIFFDELQYWDGYMPSKNSLQYSTTNKINADIVQALAHLSGRVAILKEKKMPEDKNWRQAYIVDIWLKPGETHELKVKPTVSKYNGKVYCAATKTGYFLVRRKGRVWITGNSGRLVQLQNLPQNHLADLAEARALVRSGNQDALEMLYEDIPDTLSQLIRTAFVPQNNNKFIVADFSAIEARVLAWLAGEKWRMKVFEESKDIYCSSASQMFGVPVEKHGINSELRQKGKIAELALGYGGSVGALKAMGALEMGLIEDELQPLVDAWRNSNPMITSLWWDVDRAVKTCIKQRIDTKTHGIKFSWKSGFLFIELPSGRKLAYVKPRIGENKFGGESVTYEGVGNAKKWERLESYGPKFVENIIQGTARDILLFAMKTLRNCQIVAHVHDEIIIEADKRMSLSAVCEQMGRTPPWAKGLLLRADGYECEFYKKD